MLFAVLSAVVASGEAPPIDPPRPSSTGDLAVMWSGPPDCDARDQLVERLAELAPALVVAHDGQAPVTVQARVEATPASQWSVDLEIVGPEGQQTRSFVAESCTVAAHATALVIAVTIDPVAVVTELERSEPAPAAEPAPRPDPGPTSAISPDPAPAETSSTLLIDLPSPDDELPTRPRVGARVALGVLGGGGYGPISTPTAMLALRFAVFGEHWRWSVRGAWLPPVTASIGETTDGVRERARIDGVLVATRGCGLLHAAPVEFPLCGGIEGGAIRAEALPPIQNATTGTQPYLGLELGGGLIWTPISRLGVGLELDGLVPFLSGGFNLDGPSVLRNLPIGVRALAGIEVRLP